MSQNKNNNNTFEAFTDRLQTANQYLGLGMMATATALGLVDFATHETKTAVLTAQPVYAVAESGADQPNPIRRERDDIHPHAASYSGNQRTPGRTGKA